MNYFFKSLLIMLSIFFHAQSHQIAINYKEINTWCSCIKLSATQSELLEDYFNHAKTFADRSSKNLNYQNTAEGKLLLKKIDLLVEQLLKDEPTQFAFERFTQLVKNELEQKEQEAVFASKASHRYILLSLIITGCLHCIQNKN